MKNDHLTDEILQAFLFNETQDTAIATHLKTCSTCQKRVEEYQYLIDRVKKIEPETFSFDVSGVVMDKIIEVEAKKEKNTNIVLYLILSIGCLMALAFLFPYLRRIFTPFNSFSIMANVFISVSVLSVFIFLLNDVFRQYKQKEKLLSQ